MYKAAVIGDWDSIYGFSALGLDTFRVEAEDSEQEAVELLRRLAHGHYEVIYITESLMKRISEEADRYRLQASPAVIPIPGISGNTGDGMRAVKKAVEQAVGSDIVFGKD